MTGSKPHRVILDEVKRQLREAGASSFQIAKQETEELAHLLYQGENIQACIYGFYEAGYGVLVATDKRVLFVDKRFYNLKVEDLPYNTIFTLQYHMGVYFGTCQMYTRAQNFHFRWVKKKDLLRFCQYVDTKILTTEQLPEPRHAFNKQR